MSYLIKKNDKLSLTLEGKNAVAGYLFILPFLLGLLAFMFLPILESLRMVFSNVNIDLVKKGFTMDFSAMANLKRVLMIDQEFNRLLIEEIGRMLLIVPAVIIFSLFTSLI